MLVFAAVIGVAAQLFAASEGSDQVITVVAAFGGILLVVMWCQYDAAEQQYTIRKPLLLLIIFVALIGVPVYLFRTRGIHGIYSSVLALAFFVLFLLVQQAAIEVTYLLM